MNELTQIDVLDSAYKSQRFVYFDIETIPCQDAEYLLELEASVKPPANLKKPESISAWLKENRQKAAEEAMARTSFDGGRGHVCTIAWAKNDGEIDCFHADTIAGERDVIEAFFGDLDEYHHQTLVGHNIAGFDIPFLCKRAIALGVTLPNPVIFPRDPKPWGRNIHDTMSMWACGSNRISMDNLCDILGIKGKGGFDGSMVAKAWVNSEHEKIAEYCRDDVSRVREIHQRFLRAEW